MQPMKSRAHALASKSDEELLARARKGDSAAYGELWRRHSGAGKTVARRIGSADLADDLVAEAFVRILSTMQRGSGPVSGFRPYLMATIRNVARRWAEKPQAVQVDDFDQFEDPTTVDDPAIAALDRTLTLSAFRTLPERWQTVLWYSEVEGLDPHEIAPFLGLTPNATAALSYRARAGLREAWLSMHLKDDSSAPECRWTTDHLSGYVADKLSARDRQRVADHLSTCTKCTIIAGELDHIGSRLAFVLVPLLLGSTVGASVLTSSTPASAAVAATAAPPMPVRTQLGSSSSSSSSSAAPGRHGVTRTLVVAGAGALLVAAVGASALAIGLNQAPATSSAARAPISTAAPTAAPQASIAPTPTPTPAPSSTPPPLPSPSPVLPPVARPKPPRPVIPPPVIVIDTTAPVAPIVTTPVDNSSSQPPIIAGTAEPGATVTVYDDGGTLLATATADASGAWDSGQLAGLRPTATSLSVFQTDVAGNVSPAAPVGPIAFVPTFVSPADGTDYASGDSVPIDLAGWPDAQVQVFLNGAIVSIGGQTELTLDANGALNLVATGLPPGTYTLDVNYFANGTAAATHASTSFTVLP